VEPLFLSVDEVLEIHAQQIELYGGSDGAGDPAGLESAVATPMATFGGQFPQLINDRSLRLYRRPNWTSRTAGEPISGSDAGRQRASNVSVRADFEVVPDATKSTRSTNSSSLRSLDEVERLRFSPFDARQFPSLH
jgi:hypothetical protein